MSSAEETRPGEQRYRDSTQHVHWHFSASDLALARTSCVSAEEDARYRAFWEKQVLAITENKSFRVKPLNSHTRDKVGGTAVSLFKRFFVNERLDEHEPKNVMITCIYLASKVVESHIVLRGTTVSVCPQLFACLN